MDPTPRITVALPTCNGARHLREALAGLRDQGDLAFDRIVSDDRSDDETLAIVLEECGDTAKVSVNSERLGLAGNWNRCVTLSRTDKVAIFHQDDVMKPGHLRAHLAVFDANPSTGLVASAASVIDEQGKDVPESVVGRGGCGDRDRVYSPGEFVAQLAVENPLRCSAVSLDARAHQEVGGFDPSFRYVVDWDFWRRVARRRPVAWLATPTVAIRWHSSSETHRFKTGTTDLEETARLLDTLDGTPLPDSARLRRKANHRLARAYLNRAHDALKGSDPRLARLCLDRSLALSPSILGAIAREPRLALQMALLTVAPDRAARWFGRGE